MKRCACRGPLEQLAELAGKGCAKRRRTNVSRKTMLLMTLIGQLAIGELRAQGPRPDLDTYFRQYPQVAMDVRRFTDNSLHDFAGQKQLRLRTHRLKEGRFVFAYGPLGWSGWDVVPIEREPQRTDRFAIQYEDKFLRYDPTGEQPILTMSKEQDEGTIWKATLSGAERSGGPERTTVYRRELKLEVINGPRKGWVAAYVPGRMVDDGLSIASPEQIQAKERRPVLFQFSHVVSDPADGK